MRRPRSGRNARGRAGCPPRPRSSSARASASWRAARPSHDPLGEPPQVLDAAPSAGRWARPTARRSSGAARSGIGATKRPRVSRSKRLSVWATNAQASAEHAGIPSQRPVGKLGELAVEPWRQVLADLPDHLVHDVEVVDQPLRRRRDRAFLPDDPGERAIALEQPPPAVPHVRRQGAAEPAFEQDRLARDLLGALLEPVGAEQLVPDGSRRVENGRGRRRQAPESPARASRRVTDDRSSAPVCDRGRAAITAAPWTACPLDQGVWVPRAGAQDYIELRRIASAALISTADVRARRTSRRWPPRVRARHSASGPLA